MISSIRHTRSTIDVKKPRRFWRTRDLRMCKCTIGMDTVGPLSGSSRSFRGNQMRCTARSSYESRVLQWPSTMCETSEWNNGASEKRVTGGTPPRISGRPQLGQRLITLRGGVHPQSGRACVYRDAVAAVRKWQSPLHPKPLVPRVWAAEAARHVCDSRPS